MRLLIVDDEPIAIQGILHGVDLGQLGFSDVFTANSYMEAVEILEKETVDLAICDIEMPDQSGLELMGWIEEHSPDTETIILSCHDEFAYAQQAMRMHCMEYVLKPVRYEVLTEVLERAVKSINDKRERSVMTEYGQRYIESIRGDDAGNPGDTLEKVAHYIDTHLEENLSVNALAGMAFLSADHLTRSFKKRYGKTVSEYILSQRMQLARELLRNSDLTITQHGGGNGADVGQGSDDSSIDLTQRGFGNSATLDQWNGKDSTMTVKQFKKFYGMTPREFQKEGRKER